MRQPQLSISPGSTEEVDKFCKAVRDHKRMTGRKDCEPHLNKKRLNLLLLSRAVKAHGGYYQVKNWSAIANLFLNEETGVKPSAMTTRIKNAYKMHLMAYESPHFYRKKCTTRSQQMQPDASGSSATSQEEHHFKVPEMQSPVSCKSSPSHEVCAFNVDEGNPSLGFQLDPKDEAFVPMGFWEQFEENVASFRAATAAKDLTATKEALRMLKEHVSLHIGDTR